MERDVILLAIGGLIGLASSLLTLFFVYVLEGMRLRRLWAREDELQLRQQRTQLEDILATGEPERPGRPTPARTTLPGQPESE